MISMSPRWAKARNWGLDTELGRVSVTDGSGLKPRKHKLKADGLSNRQTCFFINDKGENVTARKVTRVKQHLLQ